MRKNFQQLFDQFIYESEFVRKLSKQTLRNYVNVFNLFITLNNNNSIETLTSNNVIDFFKILNNRERIVGKGIRKSGVKKSTIATYWRKLNTFFKWLKGGKHIKLNPFESLKCPTPTYDDRKFLKKEEIEKLITAIQLHHNNNILLLKRNILILYILLFCGLRKEELLALQIRDIDLERKSLTIRKETSKSGNSRIIPLHSMVIMHLKDYLLERKRYTTPYLFVSSKPDARLTESGLKHFIERLKSLSGVSVHLHQFRHSFAVNFLKASNNIAKLKQLLGHKNISMTLVYLRCLPTDEMRGDIENMNIDKLI